MQFFPLLIWASFIYFFWRRRLEAQSKIQINSCPIPRNSRSWTFTVNPRSETLHSSCSCKRASWRSCAPTFKCLFFSVIHHSHKPVKIDCFFCLFLVLLKWINVINLTTYRLLQSTNHSCTLPFGNLDVIKIFFNKCLKCELKVTFIMLEKIYFK